MASKRFSRLTALLLGAASALLPPHAAAADEDKDKPKAKPAAPADNLDYWLKQAPEAKDKPRQPAKEGVNPFQGRRPFHRDDAVPGVVELSNGKVLPGWVYTTLEAPLKLFVEEEKHWRLAPLINLLSINAVIAEEKMELRWRWKAMGVPERVYTGEKYPSRRLLWRLRLIDGSEMTGAVKGQPIWVELGNAKVGPMVLHERSKGPVGSALDELVYIRRIIISRRLMDAVVQDGADKAGKAEQPDRPARPVGQAGKKEPAAPKP